MDNNHLHSNPIDYEWNNLRHKYTLTAPQIDKLNRYLELLVEWNEKFNLTAITNHHDIITYHFDDSLALAHYVNLTTLESIADVGTGAGFPAIPLKIMFPHLKMVLIEVNNKKRTFLNHLTQELGLTDITTYPYDWRTFLRTTDYKIDYFLARASLQPEELIRIFKPASIYKNSCLVYWASKQWTPGKIEAPFIKQEILYTLNDVERKLVFFYNQ